VTEAAVRAALVCVYRDRHAGLVERLAHDAADRGIGIALWALETPAPALASWTRGSGPGTRLSLLNRLIAQTTPDVPLLVADDDISIETGDLGLLLRRADQSRLALAQPAHTADSFINHRITRHRPHSRVRRTRFVEVGPLVLLSTTARALLTPFPEELGMGWGLDVLWSDLHAQGHRLGIVDDVTMRHHEPAATNYSRDESKAVLAGILAERGLKNVKALNYNVAVWPSLSPVPMWIPSRSAVRERLRRGASAGR
jgi:hypothetical protein